MAEAALALIDALDEPASLAGALDGAKLRAMEDRAAAAEARAAHDRISREAEARARRRADISRERASWIARREKASDHIATFEERREELQSQAEALADALSQEGYAASAQALASGGQLCQRHCPVAHVAAEFPELCQAETEVIGRLVGSHVQRLATIARGDGVCTTHVPSRGATLRVTG